MLNGLRSSSPDDFGWIGEVNTMIKSEALKDFQQAAKAYAKLKKTAQRSGSAVDAKAASKGNHVLNQRKTLSNHSGYSKSAHPP